MKEERNANEIVPSRATAPHVRAVSCRERAARAGIARANHAAVSGRPGASKDGSVARGGRKN